MRLGWMEILVLLAIVLLFFGPKRLPGLGSALGSAIRGFKKGISGAEDEEDPDKRMPPGNPTTKS